MSEARNDETTAPASQKQSVRGSGLSAFSRKEWLILLAAVLVVVIGTTAAAFSHDQGAASASPAATDVASSQPAAAPTTASVIATAPATLVSAAATRSVAATAAVTTATAAAQSTPTTIITRTITKTIIKKVKVTKPPRVSLVSTGAVVTFGSYAGKPLKWRVLDADDTGVLLFSQYVITAGAFQSDWEGKNASRYGSSEIRKWLKNDFITESFDATQTDVMLTHIGGLASGDRAFLLSAAEVKHYFPKAKSRRAAPARKASTIGLDGAPLSLSGAYAPWWVTDPGSDNFSAKVVKPNGKFSTKLVYYGNVGVRPALRLERDEINYTLGSTGGD